MWCGIKPDESPWNPNPKYGSYRQSERDYKKYAQQLVDKGYAYELDGAIRFKMKVKSNVSGNMLVYDKLKGRIEFPVDTLDDKVILKSDGTPTYHLASVVDDHLMGITHVLRGDEWLPSFPLHTLLYDAFRWAMPEFIHLSTILNPDGKGKLSKRTAANKGFEIFPLACNTVDEKDNPVSFKGFKNLGYEPEAYLNFIAQLGHTFSKDIMSMDEMIADFSFDKIHSNQPIFDVSRLDYINKEHLKTLDNQMLWWDRMTIFDKTKYTTQQINSIMDSVKERVTTWLQLPEFLYTFFFHEKTKEIGDDTKSFLNQKIIDFSSEESIIHWINTTPINKKDLREIVSSGKSGCELTFVMYMIGGDEFYKRFEKYI